jgi:hypothetical protein
MESDLADFGPDQSVVQIVWLTLPYLDASEQLSAEGEITITLTPNKLLVTTGSEHHRSGT